jgi:hypothetical protein
MLFRSNKIGQLKFKLEKKYLGFRNMQEKLENYVISALQWKSFED